MNQLLKRPLLSACTDLCRESALKFIMFDCRQANLLKSAVIFFQRAINLDLVFMFRQFISEGVRMQGAFVTAKI